MDVFLVHDRIAALLCIHLVVLGKVDGQNSLPISYTSQQGIGSILAEICSMEGALR
jgi:hypothetical protein